MPIDRPRRMLRHPRPCFLALLAAAAAWVVADPAHAGPYVLHQGDRTAFQDALLVSSASTVVDSDGAFAADPVAARSVASLVRAGSIGGKPLAYEAHDVDAVGVSTGRIVPGAVGGDIADLDRLEVELPAAQSGAVGSGSWGLDGSSGARSSRNALLIDFLDTPGNLGIAHFGLDLIDFEATFAFTPGELRLYDDGDLVHTETFGFGAGAGNGEVHFLGIVGIGDHAFFDQVLILVGDDSPGGGLGERWAADRFTFGQARAPSSKPTAPVPEPATWVLFLVAGAGAWTMRRRRAKSPD